MMMQAMNQIEETTIAAEEQMRQEILSHLKTNEKGRPRASMGNYEIILKYDPLFAGNIRQNLLTGLQNLTAGTPWRRDGTDISDVDEDNILLFIEKNYDIREDKTLHKMIDVVANEQQFHPIRDLLDSLVWDGVPRVRFALHHFLGAEVNDLNEEFLRVFMTGAVHRVFHPGCKFELMLCLIGGQGAGKSTFFRFLTMRDEWFSDDLRKLDDENVYRKLLGHWIIEMSEMIATASAKSIEEIKSFISRQKDTYKDPYQVRPRDRLRQCVFAGTTNRSDFMPKDRSGNRRFLPVRVDASKAEVHILENEQESREYIRQMWAEIMTQYRTGDYRLSLSREFAAAQNDLQKDFMQEDTDAGTLIDFIEHYTGDKVCTRQLYEEALKHSSFDPPKPWDIREICDIVNAAIDAGELPGWRRFNNPRHFGKYGKQRGWERVAEERKQSTGNSTVCRQLNGIPDDDPDDLPF